MLKKKPARASGSTLPPTVQDVATFGESGEIALLGGAALEFGPSLPTCTTAAGHPAIAGPSVAASSIGGRRSVRQRHRPARLENDKSGGNSVQMLLLISFLIYFLMVALIISFPYYL
jgi:hypothetical protein